MSGFFNLIFGVCVFTHLFYTTECAVTVTMESGDFLCGHSTKLKCVISSYGGGMTWKLDGTIIAQCAFGSCNPLGALPSGDNFTHDESTGTFFLDIGITHADNGTMYQCDDGSNQDQTTVNIKVPPHTGSSITVSGTTLSVAAGCFYPAANGKIAIYCVTGGTETLLDTVTMARTTIGCTGDCAGPGIFMATGSATIDNSTGSSAYRVKVYLDGYGSNALTLTDTSAIYDCGPNTTTTVSTTVTETTSTISSPSFSSTGPNTTTTVSTTVTETTSTISSPSFSSTEPPTTEPPTTGSTTSTSSAPCCTECCCDRKVFLIIVIIVIVITLCIVILILVVKIGTLDCKVRYYICIVLVIICFILDIAVTAYTFKDPGSCCENATCSRCDDCSTQAWPIAAVVIIWVTSVVSLIILIICVVKSKRESSFPALPEELQKM